MSPDRPPRCNRGHQPHLPKQPGEGASYPGLEIIAKLARALEIEPAELLRIGRKGPVRHRVGRRGYASAQARHLYHPKGDVGLRSADTT
jgi:hypothetical protein